MSDYQWGPLHNTFDSNTRSSHKKALTLGAYTDGALHAEIGTPAILAIYNNYHPVYAAYEQVHVNYLLRKGYYRGATTDVETQFTLMGDLKVREWEGVIRAKYVEDSPAELRFFPDKRKPFQAGTYASRIVAVKTLHQAVVDDGTFPAAFAADILSTVTILEAARLSQLEDEESFKQLRDLRNNQRELLCEELYAALGGLMVIYKADTDQIARFFDIELLHRTEQDATLTVTVLNNADSEPLEGARLVARNLVSGTETTLLSDSNGEVEFELPVGDYQLTVSLAGFTEAVEDVSLTADENEEREVRLRAL